MILSEDFEIYVSMPRRNLTLQQSILIKECGNLSIQFITADSEPKRVEKIYNEGFDIIVVGNVGKLNKIVNDKTIAIMVYHGIGLKQSYYNDSTDRINLRAIESLERFTELKNKGHKNIILTGFTKLDRLFTLTEADIRSCKKGIHLDKRKKTIL